MKAPTPEWTFYQSPKSKGFGHAATPRAPVLAWAKLESFKRQFTIPSDFRATSLTVDTQDELWDRSDPRVVIDALAKLLGDPLVTSAGIGNPSEVMTWFQSERATLSAETLQRILEIVVRSPQKRIGWRRSISFAFSFDFFWRDASTSQVPPVRAPFVVGEILDWGPRNPYSELGVIITDHLFVQPLFLFPYAAGTPNLLAMLEEISATVPFNFRPNYFRRAVPNARGDAFRLLRIK